MSKRDNPSIIKKYANRRLYHTGTSTYVTLEELGELVRKGEDFMVVDAKTGDDITRSVLAQIIFDQEGKEGQNLLPVNFLRQLIRFYGDSLQALVPQFLDLSLTSIVKEQEKLRQQMASSFNLTGMASVEDQVRKNMDMMQQAFAMFTPFGRRDTQTRETQANVAEVGVSDEVTTLKKQLAEMSQRLSALEKRS